MLLNYGCLMDMLDMLDILDLLDIRIESMFCAGASGWFG